MKRILSFAMILCLLLALPSASLGSQTQAEVKTATVMDMSAPIDSRELTLIRPKLSGIKRLTQELGQFPNLETVTLDHPDMTDKVKWQLVTAMPEIRFIFLLKWKTVELSTAQETLDLGNRRTVTREELSNLFRLMPDLKRVDMYNVRLKIKEYIRLREDFPQVEIHTQLPISGTYLRDDVSAFSTKHSSGSHRDKSAEFDALKYVPALQALDLGHNAIDDLSFLSYFPTMQVLILADNKIKDVTEIGKLKELSYAELFLNRIEDVTPLAQLTNLQDLNLAHNNISDATPLYALKGLKRLWISNNNLTDEQIEELKQNLPDTEIVANYYWSTGMGWREHSHYHEIINIFKTQVFTPLSR